MCLSGLVCHDGSCGEKCRPHKARWRGQLLKGCPQQSHLPGNGPGRGTEQHKGQQPKNNYQACWESPLNKTAMNNNHRGSWNGLKDNSTCLNLFKWSLHVLLNRPLQLNHFKYGPKWSGATPAWKIWSLLWATHSHFHHILPGSNVSRTPPHPMFIHGHVSSMPTASFCASHRSLLIERSLICSLLLDIFPLLSLSFPNSWQAVQILAVCCSPLILCQTFLLHKYTRTLEEMQSDIRRSKRLQLLIYSS